MDKNPAWAKRPWAEALKKDGLKAHLDEKALIEIVTLSEAGLSTDEFREVVRHWLSEARHPRFARPYTELTFVPMLELLGFLRQNSFKVYIVSGGSVQFMRAFAELVYGVPPEQVIGSAMETKYQFQNGKAELVAAPQLGFLDDGSGKAVAIDRIIGKRPAFIAGNSDGDFEMLEYGTSTNRLSLGLIVHHDDDGREFAYDRQSHVGKLDRALTAAPSKHWLVVSMKSDFAEVYAPKR
ncbi:MAG: HAD family hydrolase [Pseudomonadota bacterium]